MKIKNRPLSFPNRARFSRLLAGYRASSLAALFIKRLFSCNYIIALLLLRIKNRAEANKLRPDCISNQIRAH